MSPLLFLIAFHPIIAMVSRHPSRGYSLLMDYEKKVDLSLPSVGNYIYAYWKEDNSDEKVGWYLAKIISVNEDGEVTLRYRSNGSFESVCLSTIKWVHAKGNGKWYLPPGSNFLHQPANAARFSKEHKVKGFADDLTIISTNRDDHQDVLSCVDVCCRDVCLSIRPDKCYSLACDRKKIKKNITFKVGGGEM